MSIWGLVTFQPSRLLKLSKKNTGPNKTCQSIMRKTCWPGNSAGDLFGMVKK